MSRSKTPRKLGPTLGSDFVVVVVFVKLELYIYFLVLYLGPERPLSLLNLNYCEVFLKLSFSRLIFLEVECLVSRIIAI